MEDLFNLHCKPVTANSVRLTQHEIMESLIKLPGWQTHKKQGVPHLEKSFKFKDFREALAFSNKVAQLANEEDHHPAILTEWGKVTVSWWTHVIKGLHMNDIIMAAKTERLQEVNDEKL
jgi:4a-hydroxytetrahydrobiopterin dehydratase